MPSPFPDRSLAFAAAVRYSRRRVVAGRRLQFRVDRDTTAPAGSAADYSAWFCGRLGLSIDLYPDPHWSRSDLSPRDRELLIVKECDKTMIPETE